MKTIEFAGAPGVGKTTAVTGIERLARERGYHVRHFHGGGRYVPLHVKGTPRFNLAVACRNVYETLTVEDSIWPSLRLLDRGPIDSLIFSRALAACERVSEDDVAVIEKLILTQQVLDRLDLIVLLTAEGSVAAQRERKDTGRTDEGVVQNQSMLRALARETLRVRDELAALGKAVNVVDTSTISAAETRQIIRPDVEIVLAAIEGVDAPMTRGRRDR